MRYAILAGVFCAVAALAWAGSAWSPAHPFRLFSVHPEWHPFPGPHEIPVNGTVHQFDVFFDYIQVGSYMEPYAIVEMTHGNGNVTHMFVDTNRLRFTASR